LRYRTRYREVSVVVESDSTFECARRHSSIKEMQSELGCILVQGRWRLHVCR
jgi:hypothetical protein